NPAGPIPGIVGVTASLDATMFHQFVRHGDTRPVRLRNTLDVSGLLSAETGLKLETHVVPGDACVAEGAYAQTNRQLLAVCQTGIWFELTRYTVQGIVHELANG